MRKFRSIGRKLDNKRVREVIQKTKERDERSERRRDDSFCLGDIRRGSKGKGGDRHTNADSHRLNASYKGQRNPKSKQRGSGTEGWGDVVEHFSLYELSRARKVGNRRESVLERKGTL